MSKIEWCDATWNWLVGCSRISAECDRCYAAVAAASARLQQFPQYKGVEAWNGTINFAESQLDKPLKWGMPKRIFTCSMSDVFHSNVREEWRDKAFAVMAIGNWHIYQILSKRQDNMLKYINDPNLVDRLKLQVSLLLSGNEDKHSILSAISIEALQKSLWLGVTAGCQKSVDERLPVLTQLTDRGWTTFVSAEPLLEEIDLRLSRHNVCQVITGAESGKGARVMDENWVRSLRTQCVEADVAFFYKQNFVKGKKVSLPELDGKQWAEFPKERKQVQLSLF